MKTLLLLVKTIFFLMALINNLNLKFFLKNLALNIQTGRTVVMHLVPREKIPEPNIGKKKNIFKIRGTV